MDTADEEAARRRLAEWTATIDNTSPLWGIAADVEVLLDCAALPGDRCCRDMDGFPCNQGASATIHDPVEGARVAGGHSFVAPRPGPHVDRRTSDEVWGS